MRADPFNTVMDKPTDMEKWRTDLFKLRELRESMLLELGEYAQENNDLRENSAYIHMEQKIHIIDAQIARILEEFDKLNIAKKKARHALKKSNGLSEVDL